MAIPIGLQLFSVRHELEKDTPQTLRDAAAAGYAGVEFFGFPRHSAQELRTMLQDAGLQCCGWHVPFDLMQDDQLAQTITFHEALGNQYLVVPGLPKDLTATREAWFQMAEYFNQLAERLRPYGMYTGYHNHHAEFTPLEGETPWDTFFGATHADVIMQLDLGNALSGGADVVEILERYPKRARTIHLKPYSQAAAQESWEAGFRPLIGEDDIPWNDVFSLCTRDSTEWYIIEYESDAYPPMEAVSRCLTNVEKLQSE